MTEVQPTGLDYYIWDWKSLLWDALGDQTKVDRVIEIANLNGMFDPIRVAALRTPSHSQAAGAAHQSGVTDQIYDDARLADQLMERYHATGEQIYFMASKRLAELSPAALALPQGRCEVTLTDRFVNPNCQCDTYAGNLGPCKDFETGQNGNCVFCDHNESCHRALLTPSPSVSSLEARKKLAEIAQEEMMALHADQENGGFTNSGAVSYAIADRFLTPSPSAGPVACAADDKMWKISALIADLQSVLTRFGDTCVYVRRGGLSWGAVALNRRSDDEKNGVFDLQAQHDRDMTERLEQIEHLKKDRDEWRQKVWDAATPPVSEASREELTCRIELARSFIASEYGDPEEPRGDWISPEARPAHDALCLCLAALSASDKTGGAT